MNAIQKKFPDSEVVYRFVNRGNTSFPPGFADALKKEVEAMAGVVLSMENDMVLSSDSSYAAPDLQNFRSSSKNFPAPSFRTHPKTDLLQLGGKKGSKNYVIDLQEL